MSRKHVSTLIGKAPGEMAVRRRSRCMTMQKLRQAGLEVFSRYGFDGASTKMVAQRAGINEALISRYFGGKAGLLDAIILEYAREVQNESSAYATGRTLEEELSNFLTAGISAAMGHPTFLKLVLSRALLHAKFRKTISRHLHGAGEAPLMDRLREYQKQKMIDRSVDLQETVDILRLFVAGTLLHQFAMSDPVIKTKRAIDWISKAIAIALRSESL